MKRPPLVLIEWDDSALHAAGWNNVTEIVDRSRDLLWLRSVGFLIHDGKRRKVLIGSLHCDPVQEDRAACAITIPTSAVRKIRRLKKGKRR